MMLSEENFEKYERFMEDYDLLNNPRKKACPYPDCGEILEGRKDLK